MFDIINHEENSNQNHGEISPHICQDGYYQKQQPPPQQMLARMWRNWNHCTLLLGMQNSADAIKNNTEVPQKIKPRTTQ